MTMNRMYHPHSDTDRLYIPRMEGGRKLLGITGCVQNEEQNLSLYLDQLEERLLRLSKSERILPDMKDLYLQLRNRKRNKNTSNGKRNSSMVNL